MEQIYYDVKFLCTNNLMDYSLLVIIETNPKWVDLQKKRNQTRVSNMERNKSNEMQPESLDQYEVVEIDEVIEGLEHLRKNTGKSLIKSKIICYKYFR